MTSLFHSPSPAHVGSSLTTRAPIVIADANVLHSRRLVMRPLLESDLDGYTRLLRDCRRTLHDFFPLHRPGETDQQVFERQAAFSRAAIATGRAWRRVIALHDGTLIGAINLNDIVTRPLRQGELNFWMSPRFQGKGLAMEAVSMILHHAATAAPGGLELDRVWGYVAPDNVDCLRLITRLGFSRDSRSLPVQLNLAGKWINHHVYHIPLSAHTSGVGLRAS